MHHSDSRSRILSRSVLLLGLTLLAGVSIVAFAGRAMASSRTVPRLDKASAAAQSAMSVSDALGERRAIWLDRLIGTGGWVHQVVQYSVADIGGQLPNGNTIPSEYVIETWIKVDSAGRVIASRDVMTDLNGNVVQSGYTVNGRTINADSGLDVAAPSVNLRASIASDELVSSYRAQGGELSSERLVLQRDFV